MSETLTVKQNSELNLEFANMDIISINRLNIMICSGCSLETIYENMMSIFLYYKGDVSHRIYQICNLLENTNLANDFLQFLVVRGKQRIDELVYDERIPLIIGIETIMLDRLEQLKYEKEEKYMKETKREREEEPNYDDEAYINLEEQLRPAQRRKMY
jgi:hypothetical protein